MEPWNRRNGREGEGPFTVSTRHEARPWGHEPWRGGKGGKGTKPAKEKRSMGPWSGPGGMEPDHGAMGP